LIIILLNETALLSQKPALSREASTPSLSHLHDNQDLFARHSRSVGMTQADPGVHRIRLTPQRHACSAGLQRAPRVPRSGRFFATSPPRYLN
jgi:hypothetical protein